MTEDMEPAIESDPELECASDKAKAALDGLRRRWPTQSGAPIEGPFDDKPPTRIEVKATMLTGEHAVAYEAFCFASASLEQANANARTAQAKYLAALSRLSKLAAGTAAPSSE